MKTTSWLSTILHLSLPLMIAAAIFVGMFAILGMYTAPYRAPNMEILSSPNGACVWTGGESCTINADPWTTNNATRECAKYCVEMQERYLAALEEAPQ